MIPASEAKDGKLAQCRYCGATDTQEHARRKGRCVECGNRYDTYLWYKTRYNSGGNYRRQGALTRNQDNKVRARRKSSVPPGGIPEGFDRIINEYNKLKLKGYPVPQAIMNGELNNL